VILAYFAYATAVAFWLPLADSIRMRTVGVNVSLFAIYLLLALGEAKFPRRWIGVIRDWLPLALVLLAYREMGWFAPAHHTNELEHGWIVWDRLLLNDWGLRAAIEALGPLFPALLELCYALVYVTSPLALTIVYALGQARQADRLLLLYVLGVFGSYALFPYFPSEPPRTVFPGQDMPRIDTVFRQFNWWILGHGGIHTSVFPSGHVSAAFALAIGMFRVLPARPWIGGGFLILAAGIFLATVYGRYHYAVDAVAGLAVSLAAWLAVVKLERSRAGK
jgi:membrane-associated phospholipid phosphatase